MGRFKKWFSNLKLYQSLMFTFNCIFLAAILIIVIMSIIITGRISTNNYVTYTSQFLQDLQKNIEYITTDVETKSRFILSEGSVQTFLNTDSSDKSYNDAVLSAKEEVTRLTMEQKYIETLSVYRMDGHGFTVGYGPSYVNDFSVWEKQDWFQEVLQKKGMYLWTNSAFNGISSQENRILFSRIINRTDTMDGIGILVITMKSSYFSELVHNLGSPSIGEFYIYGKDGGLLFGSQIENADLQKELKTNPDFKRYGKFFITSLREPHLDWNLVCIGKAAAVLSNQWAIFMIIFLVTVLVTAIAFYIYSRFSHGITKELKRLNEKMERAEDKDFRENITIGRIQEFAQLGDSYNQLINRIHVLVNEVMQEKLNSKQAQLENMQAQINPHFLYNTLDCINWKCMASNQNEISEMVQCMSKMFRFSLGTGEQEIELEREVENTRNYLLLQKKRFEDKLVYLIDIPKEVMRHRVIKFFLQPLVENSILHGLQARPEKGCIGISVGEKENGLLIQVWDNGVGVDEMQINEILSGKTYDIGGKRHRHGIFNVNERLRLRYGEESTLKFENRKKGGTKVTIWIPEEKLNE